MLHLFLTLGTLGLTMGHTEYFAGLESNTASQLVVAADHDTALTFEASAIAIPSRQEIKNTVRLIAAQEGIDPELFYALVAAESNFNPVAVSPKGARGLTQLMPQTARDMGMTGNIFDIETNLRIGAQYLKLQIDEMQTLSNALAAYNAGPHRGRKAYHTWPRETRRYVVKILKRSGHLSDTDHEIFAELEAVRDRATETPLHTVSWVGGISDAVKNPAIIPSNNSQSDDHGEANADS